MYDGCFVIYVHMFIYTCMLGEGSELYIKMYSRSLYPVLKGSLTTVSLW